MKGSESLPSTGDSFNCLTTALIQQNQQMLLINKLCHKTSGNSRPSGEVDPVEAKLKVVTKHRFSKNLGGFRLIKVVTTITVVTAKVQPEKNRRGTPRKKPEKIMMVSFVLGTETVELEN